MDGLSVSSDAAQRILGPPTGSTWPYPSPPKAPSEEGTLSRHQGVSYQVGQLGCHRHFLDPEVRLGLGPEGPELGRGLGWKRPERLALR